MATRLQVREVARDVHRVGSRRINFYVVRDGAALTLVDCGLPRHWGGVAAACRSLGLDPSAIEAVLLTHVHSDHAGTAERVRATSHAAVRLHEGDAELTDGRTHRRTERPLLAYLWRPAALATLWELASGGGARMEAISGHVAVADGEVLDVPGRPTAVHVPGHTRGSLAFVLPDRDVCFSGDALVTLDLLTGRRGPRLLPGAFTEDSRTAVESLGRIADVGTNILLPGHGEPWHGPVAHAARLARAAGTA